MIQKRVGIGVNNKSNSGGSSIGRYGSSSSSSSSSGIDWQVIESLISSMKVRERIAWILVFTLLIFDTFVMINKTHRRHRHPSYQQQQQQQAPPPIPQRIPQHPSDIITGIDSSSRTQQQQQQQQLRKQNTNSTVILYEDKQKMIWNGGHPTAEKPGSCWCSYDNYCMCTPSLSIELFIRSGTHHLYLIQQQSDNDDKEKKKNFALVGGFVFMGESILDAIHRQLTNYQLSLPDHNDDDDITLLGFYSDPKRDSNRNTVSFVFILQISDNDHITTTKNMVRIPISDLNNLSFIIGGNNNNNNYYETILLDFQHWLHYHDKQQLMIMEKEDKNGMNEYDFMSRSTCISSFAAP